MERWDRRKYRGDGTKGSPVIHKGMSYTGVLYDPRNHSTNYLVDGYLHREDGPAVIWQSGGQEWYRNGNPHRLDGPAAISAFGTQAWWVDGKRHRLDGPAFIYWGGSQWIVDGVVIDIVDVLGYLPSVPLSQEEQMVVRLRA